jgi:hypothetical protein
MADRRHTTATEQLAAIAELEQAVGTFGWRGDPPGYPTLDDYQALAPLQGRVVGLAATLGLPAPPPLELAGLVVNGRGVLPGMFQGMYWPGGKHGDDREKSHARWKRELNELRAAAEAIAVTLAPEEPSTDAKQPPDEEQMLRLAGQMTARPLTTVDEIRRECEGLRTRLCELPQPSPEDAYVLDFEAARTIPEVKAVWAAMRRLGGPVPEAPGFLRWGKDQLRGLKVEALRENALPGLAEDVLRALDGVIAWCAATHAAAPTREVAAEEISTPATEEPPATATASEDALHWPVLISSTDLAKRLGLTSNPVEVFLRRYRAKYPDCALPTDSPRRNEPRYMYRTADVLAPVREHFGLTDG